MQTAEEDKEAADAAAAGRGEGEAGKGAGDCPQSHKSPWGSLGWQHPFPFWAALA